MNFATISSQVGHYATRVEASILAAQMKQLIDRNGYDVFESIDTLNAEIMKLDLSTTLKAQLVLVFSSSTLADFILNSKSDLDLVDINNAIHNVVSSTGLSYNRAIEIVTDVFYACGLDFPVEYGPQMDNNTIEYKLHAFIPNELADAEASKTRQILSSYIDEYENMHDRKMSAEAKAAAEGVIESIKKLCTAGNTSGFYMLGVCYLYGIGGTARDYRKALSFLKMAAKQGDSAAAALLGDIYYQSPSSSVRDNSLAHYYYTMPGALALSEKRQHALQDIYRQLNANRVTLVFSGILLVMMIFFIHYFHTGIFSGSGKLVLGIILTVLSGIIYALTILFNRIKRFNGIRWVIAVQYFTWSLYAFLLVLA